MVKQVKSEYFILEKSNPVLRNVLTLTFLPSSSILYSVTVLILPLTVSFGDGRVPSKAEKTIRLFIKLKVYYSVVLSLSCTFYCSSASNLFDSSHSAATRLNGVERCLVYERKH